MMPKPDLKLDASMGFDNSAPQIANALPPPVAAARNFISYRPTAEIFARLKEAGYRDGKSMQAIVNEAVEDWLNRRG